MRILIVEDSPELARIIARYCKNIAREVIIAEDMTHAWAEIRKAEPFDLITLDLNLPDSGIESTLQRIHEIKQEKPDALVVVVTGVVRPEEEAKIISAGADGYMHKLDFMGHPDTFLQTLYDIMSSVARNPKRYKKNVALLEKVARAKAASFEEASQTV